MADIIKTIDDNNEEKAFDAKKAAEEKLNKYKAYLNKLLNEADAADRKKVQTKNDKLLSRLRKGLDREALNEEAALKLKIIEDLHEMLVKNTLGLGNIMAANGKTMGENIYNAASKGVLALQEGLKTSVDIYTQYFSAWSTRLLDTGLNILGLFNTVSTRSAGNPFYKLTTVLEKLNSLVNAGISDNVLQRAFLGSVADKIATTFDVAQESMLQIIRIQGQDTTAARLGAEAQLTRLFNHYFGDTSYLSTQFDSILSILIDTSAQLGSKAGLEFEYEVQKWLGALGSVGVSSSTLSKIAEGINYLGTGNISALSSNNALLNLLIMAANRGGLSYTDILTQGLSAEKVNSLLAGLVDYARSINGNNVVRSQYANIFGVTLTDMKVISQLEDDVLKDLTSIVASYDDTLTELDALLTKVSSRMHLSELINNVLSNTITATGMKIANSPYLYGIYKSADMLESITGGIKMPTVGVLGSFIDPNMSIEGLIKGTILGASTIGTLWDAIQNYSAGNLLSREGWEVISNKGSGFESANKKLLITTQSNTVVYSSDSGAGILLSLFDQSQQLGESISGANVESTDEMLIILRYLRNYFEGGGSLTNPLQVSVSNYGLTGGGRS